MLDFSLIFDKNFGGHEESRFRTEFGICKRLITPPSSTVAAITAALM
jgi:hypothetical protein